MRKKTFMLMVTIGLAALLSVPSTMPAHGKLRSKGHGHPFAQREPDCRVCVPELSKKKRWVYDYICVPFCVFKCKRCKSCSEADQGCGCGHCAKGLPTHCPHCRIRTRKVLVKRQIDDGYDWKCKLKKPVFHCADGKCVHHNVKRSGAPTTEILEMPTGKNILTVSPSIPAGASGPSSAVSPPEVPAAPFFPVFRRRLFHR